MDVKVREEARKAAALAYQAERGKWRVMSIPDTLAGPLADAVIDAYEAALKAAGYVMVPRAEVEWQIESLRHDDVFDVASLKGSMSYVAVRITAMIEAATNPAP